jgi:anthranilate phosphoribosyltransferase
LLVSSEDGLDELSISAPTHVVEVLDGQLRRYDVAPEQVSLSRWPAESVPGGDPRQNAQTAREILSGEAGVARDLAVLNAGAAIYAGGRADSLAAGAAAAHEAIDSGKAASALERFVRRTHDLVATK